ncbi:hypothetical protein NGRA_1984 [Nosema granulosis]|uniref:Peptidase A2 domain-containing protein n=1 Tax=Nosema granulosis TaxID=83296 RepID=A0A9P6GYD5_9MICR|nr:hypothetical protein NGRA_1984 [Nosema granulosis]
MLNLMISEMLITKISVKRNFDMRLDALGELILNPNEYHTYLCLMKGAQRRKFPDIVSFITFIREFKIRAELCNKNDKISEREVTDVVIKSLSKREKEILMNSESRTLNEIEDFLQKASHMMSFYQVDDYIESITTQGNMSNLEHTPAVKQNRTYHKSPFHSTQDCRAKRYTAEKNKRKSQNLVTVISSWQTDQITSQVEMSNKTYTFLVDTGSQENFIAEYIAKKFDKSVQKCKKHITLADDRTQEVNRNISLRFKLPAMKKSIKKDFI